MPAPFKELKHDLAIRPISHPRESRIEAHIFVAFIASCLYVTLKNLARPCAPGLTPRAILEKFATLQMLDVHLPTTDGQKWSPKFGQGCKVVFALMRGPYDDGKATQFFT